MEGIIQVPIDAAIGNTFAQCLRAILRQDPDKILVGEIRDLETAEIAVQASLTGHMVFSTLHTNDAPSTITRMKDMGVPTFLITATVEAILAQRLVRRVCTKCREEYVPSKEILDDLELTAADLKGKTVLSWLWLRKLQQYRIQGTRRTVRADDHEQRAPRDDHAKLLNRRTPQGSPEGRHDHLCEMPA